MPWCKVTIKYDDYSQNYKRHLAVHHHQLSQQFTRDALADSLQRINANLLPEKAVTQNLLGIERQADQLGADPGPRYRLI